MLDCPNCGIRHYAPSSLDVHVQCVACGNRLVAPNSGSSQDPAGVNPQPGGRRFLLEPEAVAAYVHWRGACEEVRRAYEHWGSSSSSQDVALAFAAYCASLDREEQAARTYSNTAERFRACTG